MKKFFNIFALCNDAKFSFLGHIRSKLLARKVKSCSFSNGTHTFLLSFDKRDFFTLHFYSPSVPSVYIRYSKLDIVSKGFYGTPTGWLLGSSFLSRPLIFCLFSSRPMSSDTWCMFFVRFSRISLTSNIRFSKSRTKSLYVIIVG